MGKITLGNRPKTFKKAITVTLPEGGTGVVTMNYLYRTRVQFGALVDEMINAAGVAPPKSEAPEDVAFSLRTAMETGVEKNAEYILRVADGWDIDEDFNATTVRRLCDELPGAALDIIETYRAAVTEGRLGN